MNWKAENHILTKDFELTDFDQAIQFVNKVALLAEGMNHHPDILIHSYKKVRVSLTTHSKGAITKLDYELAEKIDHIR